MLSPTERDAMEARRRAIESELEQLQDVAEDEDQVTAERIDALNVELQQLQQALYPDDAERQRAAGKSERD